MVGHCIFGPSCQLLFDSSSRNPGELIPNRRFTHHVRFWRKPTEGSSARGYRGTQYQQAVLAGCGDVECALGLRLAFHIGQVGAYDALTDGLILLRYLFGLSGASMTSGVVGPNATRTDPMFLL